MSFTNRSRFLAPGLLALFAVASFLSSLSPGDVVLMSDNFSYPDGNLVGNGGWANHSGTGSFIQVNSGQVRLEQGAGSREDANKAIGATITASDIWKYEFDVTVTGATPVTPVYFAHLRDDGIGFSSRLYVTAGTGNDFTFGVGESSTITGTWGTSYAFGSTHRVSVEYNAASLTSRLWVNGDVSSAVQSTAGASLNNLQTFAFRQAGGNTNMVIDNLVVSSLTAIPEPSSMALLGLVGVGGMAVRKVRRKKLA